MTTATNTAAVRAAFLSAILAEPHEDDLRLIFTDWLEDHGELHGARLIRGQIAGEVASLPLTWSADAIDLLAGAGVGWRGGVETGPGYSRWYGLCECDVTWRRGFVHTVRLPTALWLQHRVELVRNHPIERVELTDKKAILDGGAGGVFRWTVFLMESDCNMPHQLCVDLVGAVQESLINELWSIHDTEPLAIDWLSARLISRAKELAKEDARDQ